MPQAYISDDEINAFLKDLELVAAADNLAALIRVLLEYQVKQFENDMTDPEEINYALLQTQRKLEQVSNDLDTKYHFQATEEELTALVDPLLYDYLVSQCRTEKGLDQRIVASDAYILACCLRWLRYDVLHRSN